MFEQRLALMAAGVVYCCSDGYRVVIATDGQVAVIGDVRPARRARRRGDVLLMDEDRHAIGLMPGEWMIRVDGARMTCVAPVTPTGTLPPAVMARVVIAAQRAVVARETERRAGV